MKSPIVRGALAALAVALLAPAGAAQAQAPVYTLGVAAAPQAPTATDPITLTAAPGTPAGDPPPVVTWDLDADGAYDDATGVTVTRTFDAGDHLVVARAYWDRANVTRTSRLIVRVTGGVPGTPTTTTTTPAPAPAPPTTTATTPAATIPAATTPTPPPPPPACTKTAAAGAIRAGTTAGGCFSVSGQRYTAHGAVSVNGLLLTPSAGRDVVVDLAAKTIASDSAKVTFKAHNALVEAATGKVAWHVGADGKLTGFAFGPTANLGGMKLMATPSQATLLANGTSRLGLLPALPGVLGGATAGAPITVTLGGANASAFGAFEFKVPLAKLPGLGLHDLVVSYDGDGLWDIAAGVTIPAPAPIDIDGDVGILHGAFEHAQAKVDFHGHGPTIGPVMLQRISFRVEIHPKKSECVPKTGIEKIDVAKLVLASTGVHVPATILTIDHGNPVLALCGTVGLTGGPSVAGKAAVSVDGGLGFAVYDDRPDVFRAFGNFKLVEIPLAEAFVEVHTNGYVHAHADLHYGWSGIATVGGFVDFEMKLPRFNAEAYVKACLEFVDFCAGAHGLISSKGMAMCLQLDTFLGDWHPGFGYRWGKKFKLYFSGCDIGPYKEAISASAAAAGSGRSVRLPGGLPGATIVVQGRGGAVPHVVFAGPHGERIDSGDGLAPVGGHGFFVLKDPNSGVTEIAIAKPAHGAWRVLPQPGSAPIASVRSAHGLRKPEVHATVAGSGQRRALRYRIARQPGQVVRFEERGPSAGGSIGTAHGASGTLRWAPAPGTAEDRKVVAVVEQDGQVRATLTVAHYRAPHAPRPGRVRHLRVRRSGGGLAIAWSPAPGAVQHEVRVALSDGRRLLLRTHGRTARVRHVPRSLRASATVRGQSDAGLEGRPVTARARRR